MLFEVVIVRQTDNHIISRYKASDVWDLCDVEKCGAYVI